MRRVKTTRLTGSFSVRKVNLNFAPQLGVAWDLKGNRNTVLREGIGLYCENVIYNNIFGGSYREKTGKQRPQQFATAFSFHLVSN